MVRPVEAVSTADTPSNRPLWVGRTRGQPRGIRSVCGFTDRSVRRDRAEIDSQQPRYSPSTSDTGYTDVRGL